MRRDKAVSLLIAVASFLGFHLRSRKGVKTFRKISALVFPIVRVFWDVKKYSLVTGMLPYLAIVK